MRNYERQISYESLNNFVDYAFKKGYEVEVFEGVLNDTYIIHAYKDFGIKGVKNRDYIILYPKFSNEWSNSFHILLTDDENKVEEFRKVFA
jgi:hypothetical protein